MFETISFQVTLLIEVTHNSFILETDKGRVYLAHHEQVNTKVVNEVDLVVSCFYQGEKSPFSESFRGRPVTTLMKDGALTATCTCTTVNLSILNESEIDSKIDKLKQITGNAVVPSLAYKAIKSLMLPQKIKYILYLSIKTAIHFKDDYQMDLTLQFNYLSSLMWESHEELNQYKQIQEYILQFVV
jgi:hypothetical protein